MFHVLLTLWNTLTCDHLKVPIGVHKGSVFAGSVHEEEAVDGVVQTAAISACCWSFPAN